MDKKRDRIIQELLEMVRGGRFPEGGSLPPERDLALQLGVGRNLLREAIVSLEALGVLEVRERQGIFVRSLPTDTLLTALQQMQIWPEDMLPQLTEMRQILSVPAAELAALRRTEKDLSQLRECLDRFERAPIATVEDQHASARWESLLHGLVVQAAHNPVLTRVYEGLSYFIEKNSDLLHLRFVLTDRGWLEHIAAQHRGIVDALERRDPQGAGALMKAHFEDTRQMMERAKG